MQFARVQPIVLCFKFHSRKLSPDSDSGNTHQKEREGIMKHAYTTYWKLTSLLIVFFIQLSGEAYASHAQGGDLTYTCLGGNQYQLRLSFYRDCAGVNA